jgi:hypothetical protein
VCFAIASELNFNKLFYYFLGNLVTTSNYFYGYKRTLYGQLKSYLYYNVFYRVNVENNLMMNYFSICDCQLIYFALHSFYLQGSSGQILTFLVQLAEIITIYPFPAYIQEWCCNLIDFHYDFPDVFNPVDFSINFPKLCWKNCYLICYYFFCLGSKGDRPIL